LTEDNDHRRRQAEKVRAGLADCPELSFQEVSELCAQVYHPLAARVDGIDRDALMARLFALRDQKYCSICAAMPLFQAFGYYRADSPHSEHFFDHMISFPWWTEMSDVYEPPRRARGSCWRPTTSAAIVICGTCSRTMASRCRNAEDESSRGIATGGEITRGTGELSVPNDAK